MSKTTKLVICAGFVLLIAFILYGTIGLDQITCEVCVEFHGRMSCRSAAGTSRAEAVKTAQGVACSDLASGRAETIACGEIPPARTTCK